MTSTSGLTADDASSFAAAHPLVVLTDAARGAASYELAGLVDACAQALGALGALIYLSDLQQRLLVPFVMTSGPGQGPTPEPLDIDATLAGRAYQTFEVQVQDISEGGTLAWFPLLAGADRLGVLAVTVTAADTLEEHGGRLSALLARLADATAELVATKTSYGDTLVRLRRTGEVGLAAEIQWSLLPPLTFASRLVTVTAALEPAYNVAGDTIDYAVDAGVAHVAIFDVMGHSLQSAQCAVLCVAAYRNARRGGDPLVETLHRVDDALLAGFGGDVFATAVLAQLNTGTGVFEWVNSGHPEPLLLRGGKLIKGLHVEPYPPVGSGISDAEAALGHNVEVGHEQLEPGDRILLFTDGVVEARSPSGEFFGVDRLVDLVLRHLAGGLPAAETMRRVVRELLVHHEDRLNDDASLLLLHWGGEQRADDAAVTFEATAT